MGRLSGNVAPPDKGDSYSYAARAAGRISGLLCFSRQVHVAVAWWLVEVQKVSGRYRAAGGDRGSETHASPPWSSRCLARAACNHAGAHRIGQAGVRTWTEVIDNIRLSMSVELVPGDLAAIAQEEARPEHPGSRLLCELHRHPSAREAQQDLKRADVALLEENLKSRPKTWPRHH